MIDEPAKIRLSGNKLQRYSTSGWLAQNAKICVYAGRVSGWLRTVPLDAGFVHVTRSLGICLGD